MVVSRFFLVGGQEAHTLKDACTVCARREYKSDNSITKMGYDLVLVYEYMFFKKK